MNKIESWKKTKLFFVKNTRSRSVWRDITYHYWTFCLSWELVWLTWLVSFSQRNIDINGQLSFFLFLFYVMPFSFFFRCTTSISVALPVCLLLYVQTFSLLYTFLWFECGMAGKGRFFFFVLKIKILCLRVVLSYFDVFYFFRNAVFVAGVCIFWTMSLLFRDKINRCQILWHWLQYVKQIWSYIFLPDRFSVIARFVLAISFLIARFICQ